MTDRREMVVFKGEDGWRWHEWTSTVITAESGEAYEHKSMAIDQAKAHKREGYEFTIEHVDADGDISPTTS